jgi:uncharacterized protein
MALKFRVFTVTCPSCDSTFETRGLSDRPIPILRGSDFHDRYRPGESVLPYLLHYCEHCGLCAEEKFFTEEHDRVFRLSLGDFVEELLTPNIRWSREYLADRYHHALRIAQFCDETPMHMGDLCLRAAWASVEENDPESERFFRIAAANNYTVALRSYDMVPREQRAQVTYLIGELWRRIGDDALANSWFAAVEEAAQAEQQWVVALAERQRLTPLETL